MHTSVIHLVVDLMLLSKFISVIAYVIAAKNIYSLIFLSVWLKLNCSLSCSKETTNHKARHLRT